jgi:acyl-coenzyme A synthetase/AMP-(fatty) acid ligase
VPADVEEIVDQVPGVRYCAAVGVDSERTGTQRLYVVAELRDATHPPTTVREIVQRVHRGQGHRPSRVLLVQASTIPKTSSGKIQRSRLVQMIEAGELAGRVIE